MLALDLVENQRRLGVIALPHPVPGRVVEGVDVAGDVARVRPRPAAPPSVAQAESGTQADGEREEQRGTGFDLHGGLLSGGSGGGQAASRIRAARAMNARFNGASLTRLCYARPPCCACSPSPTLFPNGARPTLGVFVERQTRALAALPDVEVEVVAPVGLPAWPLSLHPHYAAAARAAGAGDAERPRPSTARATGSGRGSARPAPRGRWPTALLPVLREIRARFPFDVIDAEFFWPDGPAAMRLAAALGVPFSVKARGSDIHHLGRAARRRARRSSRPGKAAGGLLAVSAALKRDMVALGLPDGEDPRPSYRHRPRRASVPSASGAKAALGVGGPLLVARRPSHAAQGPGSRARGAGADSGRDPAPRRRRPRPRPA